ncbi:MAG: phosphodiester glycosidase family protein [Myxococcales bacterium]|nr:MAG: phosphodiester glycosidase family protein [Myxococcales bacterium]
MPGRNTWASAIGWCVALFGAAAVAADVVPPAEKAAGAWTRLAPGLETAHIEAAVPPAAESFRLQAFKIDLSAFAVLAADARQFASETKTATAREMRERLGAELAVNGTFFDEKGRPLGLVISGGKEFNPLRRADWGVFYIADGKANLMHTRDWFEHPPSNVDFAMQVGPRIIVDGKPLTLKPQVSRRAALGVQPDGKMVIVAVTDRGQAEAGDLARLMAKPEAEGGLGCRQALMLDGGPSAQLSASIGEFTFDIVGGWPVPVGVAFVRKPQNPSP